jgi:hypothetical protein
MNSQPANTYPASYPDARIDQVLDALRTTEPPTGLEQRIAARLAQAAEARTVTTSPFAAAAQPASISPFAVILSVVKDPRILLAAARRYSVAAAALALLIALTTITLLHHSTPATTARTTPVIVDPSSSASLNGAGLQSRHTAPPSSPASAAEGYSAVAATNQVPRDFSLGSHAPFQEAKFSLPPSAQDPEAIALAETLAPSRPAPPMPLTAQEKLIQAATRPGQPLQLAELDLARAPVLRAAAQARETASIDRYVRSLLAPFAVADALQPTTFSQPQEAPTSAPAPPNSNNPSN